MSDTEIIVEPNRQDIIQKHTFDAPRDLVFRAMTEPELVPKWWGPRDLSTEVDVMESRTGGRWRYINRDANGNVYAFSGVFHEVTAPERIVQTFEFEGMTGHVALEPSPSRTSTARRRTWPRRSSSRSRTGTVRSRLA